MREQEGGREGGREGGGEALGIIPKLKSIIFALISNLWYAILLYGIKSGATAVVQEIWGGREGAREGGGEEGGALG